jgi:hypothetical protein
MKPATPLPDTLNIRPTTPPVAYLCLVRRRPGRSIGSIEDQRSIVDLLTLVRHEASIF